MTASAAIAIVQIKGGNYMSILSECLCDECRKRHHHNDCNCLKNRHQHNKFNFHRNNHHHDDCNYHKNDHHHDDCNCLKNRHRHDKCNCHKNNHHHDDCNCHKHNNHHDDCFCDDRFSVRLGGLTSGMSFRLRQLLDCDIKIIVAEENETIQGKLVTVGTDFIEVLVRDVRDEKEKKGKKRKKEKCRCTMQSRIVPFESIKFIENLD